MLGRKCVAFLFLRRARMSRFFVAWCLHGGILLEYGNGALVGYCGCGTNCVALVECFSGGMFWLWNITGTERIALHLWNVAETEQLGKSQLQTVEWCKLRRRIVELGQKETPRLAGFFC